MEPVAAPEPPSRHTWVRTALIWIGLILTSVLILRSSLAPEADKALREDLDRSTRKSFSASAGEEEFYQAVLKEFRRAEAQDPGIALNLCKLAVSSYGEGRYTQARRFIALASAMCDKGLGSEKIVVDTNHCDVAAQRVYWLMIAIVAYHKAIEINEKTLGPEHSELAASLERFAAFLRTHGSDAESNRKEAAALEARAKAIRAKHQPK